MSLRQAHARGRMTDIEQLTEYANVLNDDEMAVLLRIARRLADGHAEIGELDLSRDRRDLIEETLEEVGDALNYVAMRMQQLKRVEG